MSLTILYFAAARERAGTARESVELSATTVAALLDALCARHPTLAPVRKHLRVAVNQQFVSDADVVPEGAEVALIPPVSGGSGPFQILSTPISLPDVVELVSGPLYGGLVTFTGAVRDNTRGRKVERLEYEAYAPMAIAKMAELAAEVEASFGPLRVAIVHRVGVLLPGEAAVAIAVAAPHRKEAFRACEQLIDRLKQDVPIWKKEVFADGEVWVGLGP